MLEWSSLKQKAEQIKALRWDSNRQMSDAVAVAVHLQRDVKKVFQCYTYWLLVYFINNGLNFTFYSWNKYRRRKWQPTPVFLPGESRGQRRLVGYSLWDHKESDMTEWLTFHFHHNKTSSHRPTAHLRMWNIANTVIYALFPHPAWMLLPRSKTVLFIIYLLSPCLLKTVLSCITHANDFLLLGFIKMILYFI